MFWNLPSELSGIFGDVTTTDKSIHLCYKTNEYHTQYVSVGKILNYSAWVAAFPDWFKEINFVCYD